MKLLTHNTYYYISKLLTHTASNTPMTPKSITPATVPDITGASHTAALVGSSKEKVSV